MPLRQGQRTQMFQLSFCSVLVPIFFIQNSSEKGLNKPTTERDPLEKSTQKPHREREMYRLSEHSLAIEKGRRRQTWLSREDRLCAHWTQNEVETELHFLTSCPMYDHVRNIFPSDYTDPQRI